MKLGAKTLKSRISRGYPTDELALPTYATMRGARNPAAKLTAASVLEIRAGHKSGVPTRALARLHGVSPRQIRRVLTGVHWAYVTLAILVVA